MPGTSGYLSRKKKRFDAEKGGIPSAMARAVTPKIESLDSDSEDDEEDENELQDELGRALTDIEGFIPMEQEGEGSESAEAPFGTTAFMKAFRLNEIKRTKAKISKKSLKSNLEGEKTTFKQEVKTEVKWNIHMNMDNSKNLKMQPTTYTPKKQFSGYADQYLGFVNQPAANTKIVPLPQGKGGTPMKTSQPVPNMQMKPASQMSGGMIKKQVSPPYHPKHPMLKQVSPHKNMQMKAEPQPVRGPHMNEFQPIKSHPVSGGNHLWDPKSFNRKPMSRPKPHIMGGQSTSVHTSQAPKGKASESDLLLEKLRLAGTTISLPAKKNVRAVLGNNRRGEMTGLNSGQKFGPRVGGPSSTVVARMMLPSKSSVVVGFREMSSQGLRGPRPKEYSKGTPALPLVQINPAGSSPQRVSPKMSPKSSPSPQSSMNTAKYKQEKLGDSPNGHHDSVQPQLAVKVSGGDVKNGQIDEEDVSIVEERLSPRRRNSSTSDGSNGMTSASHGQLPLVSLDIASFSENHATQCSEAVETDPPHKELEVRSSLSPPAESLSTAEVQLPQPLPNVNAFSSEGMLDPVPSTVGTENLVPPPVEMDSFTSSYQEPSPYLSGPQESPNLEAEEDYIPEGEDSSSMKPEGEDFLQSMAMEEHQQQPPQPDPLGMQQLPSQNGEYSEAVAQDVPPVAASVASNQEVHPVTPVTSVSSPNTSIVPDHKKGGGTPAHVSPHEIASDAPFIGSHEPVPVNQNSLSPVHMFSHAEDVQGGLMEAVMR